MSKKLLYLLLTGALSITVLAACGETTDDPAITDDLPTEDVTEDSIE